MRAGFLLGDAAFGTFHTDILEARMPGYVRPNFCDVVRDSRWESEPPS